MQFHISKINELIPGSKYFRWSEALYLSSLPGYASPSLMQQQNICKQAEALDRIRDYFNRPMRIHSWLRPQIYNKAIGGASMSQHMLGLATDFSIAGLTAEEVRSAIRAHGLYPGRGELDTPTWVHLDLGGKDWFKP